MIRVSDKDATRPTAIPMPITISPRPRTLASTLRDVAPKATRMPISFVRCVTEWLMTP